MYIVVKPAAGLRAHLTVEESVRSEACRTRDQTPEVRVDCYSTITKLRR